MISLDSETNGLDLRHSARPFFVTICNEEGEVTFWEFNVDPLTREVIVPKKDLIEIKGAIHGQEIVMQNGRFDVTALSSIDPYFKEWDWENTYDTLPAGHLLASGQPHDLTTMALVYLNHDIQPLEKKLEKAVKECRDICRRDLPDWAIAKEGRADMPSAGAEVWRYDYWLPRAIAKHFGYAKDHPYWTVLSDYANEDSSVTLPLWKRMRYLIEQRGLWKIYEETRKLQRTTFLLEQNGVTLSKAKVDHLIKHYSDTAEEYGAVCVNLAKGMGFDLKLPKGASPNDTVRDFVYNHLKVEPLFNKKSKTGNPSLNKDAFQNYLLTTEGKPLLFFKRYEGRKTRSTRVSYMRGYERFWKDLGEGYCKLHTSYKVNGTSTLRFSSANPNLTNIGKDKDSDGYSLKYCFGPRPGRVWYSLDFKNIELRIPAYESEEPSLIELFERPNDPPFYGSQHLLNFSIVYPDIWAAAVKEVGIDKAGPYCKTKYKSTWYQWVKNGDFSIGYQAGDATADAAFHCKGARKLLIGQFSKQTALNNHYVKFANKYGYVETIPDVTIDPERGYPIQCTRGSRGNISPTIPLNYHVQSSAMQLTRKAMYRCQERLDEWAEEDGFDGFLTLQVHDELVFDFPQGEGKHPHLDKVLELKALMEQGGQDLVIKIPSPCGVELHTDNFNDSEVLY